VEERFDRQLAASSLCFYEAADVPAIDVPIPREISEIRFRADLSDTDEADTSRLASEGGLFRGILPVR
jgi:hypothetical protein